MSLGSVWKASFNRIIAGSFKHKNQIEPDKDRKQQVKKFDSKNVYPSDGRQRFSDGDLANLSNNLDILLTQPSDAGSRMTRSKGIFRFIFEISEIIWSKINFSWIWGQGKVNSVVDE